jgi:hypothetical protein
MENEEGSKSREKQDLPMMAAFRQRRTSVQQALFNGDLVLVFARR